MKELTEQDKAKLKEIEHAVDCLVGLMKNATTIMAQMSSGNFDPIELERLTGKKYGDENE